MTYIFLLIFTFQVIIFLAGAIISLRNPAGGLNGTDRELPLKVRVILSLSLVLTALSIWTSVSGKDSVYTLFVFLGMSFAFVGDLIMADVIKLKDRLVGGMLFFAVAHLLYITAYINTIHSYDKSLKTYIFYALVIFISASTLGWMNFIKNKEKPKKVNNGSLIYGYLIAIMGAFAFTLALTLGGKWWITSLAAVIFMSSDMLIGVTEIGKMKIKNVSLLVWLTYVAAQMGIIYSVLL